MFSLEQIAARLQDRNLSKIARDTGLSRLTLYRVRDGRRCTLDTLEALSEYFRKQEARYAKTDRRTIEN